MISQRVWVTVRKRKALSGRPGVTDRWRVVRKGWFLFGIVPLFLKDVDVEMMG